MKKKLGIIVGVVIIFFLVRWGWKVGYGALLINNLQTKKPDLIIKKAKFSKELKSSGPGYIGPSCIEFEVEVENIGKGTYYSFYPIYLDFKFINEEGNIEPSGSKLLNRLVRGNKTLKPGESAVYKACRVYGMRSFRPYLRLSTEVRRMHFENWDSYPKIKEENSTNNHFILDIITLY